jgi:hypothetical protein
MFHWPAFSPAGWGWRIVHFAKTLSRSKINLMARPFNLNDLRAIRELQPHGIDFDFERARLWPHTPLAAALAARLPFNEIGASTIVLYQNHGKHKPLGVIQSRVRRNRPEADISFIAPALDAHPDAVTIWYRLLAEATNEMCDGGCQRFYVQVPGENGTEEVFRQAGFTVYAHQDVYYLPAERITSFPPMQGPRTLRRQRRRDAWQMVRLYTLATPRPVQIAEGTMNNEGKIEKLGDWEEQASGTGYVLEGTDAAVLSAVRITRGRAANWLRLYLHPESQDHAGELVCGALGLVHTSHPRPVYCGVRDYEGGIRGPLEGAGFQPILKQSLMVKHTTVRVKEPVPWSVPALEKPAPLIHTRSHARERETEELQTA